MSDLLKPIDYFSTWLPGELAYSAHATKGPYKKKLERAAIDPSDDGSITRYLSSEWFQARRLSDLGVHAADRHQMTAQLQFAKFAAGLFDKASVAIWLGVNEREDPQSTDTAILQTIQKYNETRPWATSPYLLTNSPEELLDKPFEETPFATGIPLIQEMLVELDQSSGGNKETMEQLIANTMALGGLATAAYGEYANTYLNPDEFWLPTSQLAS